MAKNVHFFSNPIYILCTFIIIIIIIIILWLP